MLNFPILVVTVTGRCLPVFEASLRVHAPQQTNVIIEWGSGSSYGEDYNAAMQKIFEYFDELIFTADDVVITPHTFREFEEDLVLLKHDFGDKLGLVATYSDTVRDIQNIQCTRRILKRVERLSPLFCWMSRKAFNTVRFPPINWYSDDVICEDLNQKGFAHFVTQAYVHHAGSQTVGENWEKNNANSAPWLKANRPEYVCKWQLPM